ncbi:MAG: VIT1/CCC1 transporter family protein [Candidatus ainarchaeum sp.]|nr:VIT1/CCC1 transporter family protein [Candidatus ainarchaeum sp.]
MADKAIVHAEKHRSGRGQLLRNIILGSQDGIVNVLGIILGVAVSTHSTSIVLLAGLAATFAESISMAAVAYTSSRAEQEHYDSEVKREKYEMDNLAEAERKEIEDIYKNKGFSGKLLKDVVDKICSDKRVWLDTMMREELHLANPIASMSPFWQGVLVGGSAIIGSFVPLAPFFFLPIAASMAAAVVVSSSLLFLIGAYKSQLTSGKWLQGGLEMMLIGGAAALAGYAVGALFQVPVA